MCELNPNKYPMFLSLMLFFCGGNLVAIQRPNPNKGINSAFSRLMRKIEYRRKNPPGSSIRTDMCGKLASAARRNKNGAAQMMYNQVCGKQK